jgi:hypothetical protein
MPSALIPNGVMVNITRSQARKVSMHSNVYRVAPRSIRGSGVNQISFLNYILSTALRSYLSAHQGAAAFLLTVEKLE